MGMVSSKSDPDLKSMENEAQRREMSTFHI